MRPCLTSLPSFDEEEERIFHKGSGKSRAVFLDVG